MPIWVVRHSWHTGLVLERANVPTAAWPDTRTLVPSRYVEVGWGDRAYWEAERFSLRLAFDAIRHPNPAVLRFVAFDGPLDGYRRDDLVRLDLSPAAVAALCRFVQAAYEPGPTLVRRVSADETEEFQPARGAYDLFHTSNTWTADALRAAGLPVRVAGTLTAGQVMRQVRRLPGAVPLATPP